MKVVERTTTAQESNGYAAGKDAVAGNHQNNTQGRKNRKGLASTDRDLHLGSDALPKSFAEAAKFADNTPGDSEVDDSAFATPDEQAGGASIVTDGATIETHGSPDDRGNKTSPDSDAAPAADHNAASGRKIIDMNQETLDQVVKGDAPLESGSDTEVEDFGLVDDKIGGQALNVASSDGLGGQTEEGSAPTRGSKPSTGTDGSSTTVGNNSKSANSPALPLLEKDPTKKSDDTLGGATSNTDGPGAERADGKEDARAPKQEEVLILTDPDVKNGEKDGEVLLRDQQESQQDTSNVRSLPILYPLYL